MPFLQIGEHKYGKPILDRAVSYQTDLSEALKVGLIPAGSTMRSNLAVGLPIDIAVIRRDALKADVLHRIEVDEPYFHDLRERWSAALRAAHKAIPRPPMVLCREARVRVVQYEVDRPTRNARHVHPWSVCQSRGRPRCKSEDLGPGWINVSSAIA